MLVQKRHGVQHLFEHMCRVRLVETTLQFQRQLQIALPCAETKREGKRFFDLDELVTDYSKMKIASVGASKT